MINIAVILTLPLIAVYNLSVQAAMSSNLSKLQISPETGIMKGAEPVYLKGSNSKAVLMIHGYIGSPTDYGRLPELVNRLGYTVAVPLLPGHGRDPREFSKISAQELIDYVDAEYLKLAKTHDEVIVIGFSMGGALATLLESKYQFKQLVLLAPYYEIAHQWYYLLPAETYADAFTPHVPYLYRPKSFKQVNDRRFLDKIIAYDYISTKGSQAAIELGKRAHPSAKNIKARTLIIHSKKDKATSYRAAKEMAGSLNSLDKFVSLEKSNHMILWDYESELVEKEILNFLGDDYEKKTNGR